MMGVQSRTPLCHFPIGMPHPRFTQRQSETGEGLQEPHTVATCALQVWVSVRTLVCPGWPHLRNFPRAESRWAHPAWGGGALRGGDGGVGADIV